MRGGGAWRRHLNTAFHHPRLRCFSNTPRPRSTNPSVFATNDGAEQAQLWEALAPLLRDNGGHWDLHPESKSIERVLEFKTFGNAWRYMHVVAGYIKVRRHHPEWSNVYKRVFIRWTTHSYWKTGLAGISSMDIKMAMTCDLVAKDFDFTDCPTSSGRAARLVAKAKYQEEKDWPGESVEDEGETVER